MAMSTLPNATKSITTPKIFRNRAGITFPFCWGNAECLPKITTRSVQKNNVLIIHNRGFMGDKLFYSNVFLIDLGTMGTYIAV